MHALQPVPKNELLWEQTCVLGKAERRTWIPSRYIARACEKTWLQCQMLEMPVSLTRRIQSAIREFKGGCAWLARQSMLESTEATALCLDRAK